MEPVDDLVQRAGSKIARIIRDRAGPKGLTSPASIRRLCLDSFGIRVRSTPMPLDCRGAAMGDLDDDHAVIVVNSAQPALIQMHILLHELAECLACRGAAVLGDIAELPVLNAALSSSDIRHQVALVAESELAAEMGIDRPKSSWSVASLLRVMPPDPKYARPRTEIEYVRWDGII